MPRNFNIFDKTLMPDVVKPSMEARVHFLAVSDCQFGAGHATEVCLSVNACELPPSLSIFAGHLVISHLFV